jgi:hypothetical protein
MQALLNFIGTIMQADTGSTAYSLSEGMYV